MQLHRIRPVTPQTTDRARTRSRAENIDRLGGSRAAAPGATVLIIEAVADEEVLDPVVRTLDMIMLAIIGPERTSTEFDELLGVALASPFDHVLNSYDREEDCVAQMGVYLADSLIAGDSVVIVVGPSQRAMGHGWSSGPIVFGCGSFGGSEALAI